MIDIATHDAGDARLSIFPDASQFQKCLKADLEKINVDFKVQVHPNLAQATTDLERWRQQQQRNKIELKVDVDTAAAAAKIGALERTLKSFGGGSGGGSGGGGGIGGALKLNAGVLGIGSLPAAAAAISSVAASIQQLAGAGAALPGAFGALGVTVGTVKLGLVGVSDAFKAVEKASDGTQKSIDASNAALAKLAPSAQEAVRAAADLKTQLTAALVIPDQQNLFDGLAASARTLVNNDLPAVQKGTQAIATALNGNVKQALASLGSGSSQGFLDRIFGNTADAQTRATKAIDPIIHAFGTLSATGSDVLPRLADGLTKVSERFDNFITKADANGSLSKWINDGITGLTQVGDIALNIGKSFTAITQAAGTGGLLTTIDSLSGKLSTFLNSSQGQADLKNFFAEGKDQLAKWEPIISNLVSILPSLYDGAKQWTDALLPALQQVTDLLKDNPQLVQDVATAFVAWKSITGVTGLLGQLGNDGVLGALGKIKGFGPIALAMTLEIDAVMNTRSISDTIFNGFADLVNKLPAGPIKDALLKDNHLAGSSIPGLSPSDNARHNNGTSATPGADAPGPARGVLPTSPNTAGGTPTIGGIPIPGLIMPGKATGGVLPGYSPGKDNMLVPMSGGEGVITPTITRALGGKAGIDAINRGALTHGYAGGGIVDPNGNPITPGVAPGPGGFVPGAGPAPIAGNGVDSGGVGGIFSSILGGLGGPISNIAGLAGGLGGGGQSAGTGFTSTGSFMDRLAGVPGIAGLIGSAGSSDPAAALGDFGQKTGKYLGGFAAKTLGSFGSALWSGALGLVGLDNSILSPTNPYFQDIAKSAGAELGPDSLLGNLFGGGSSSSSAKKGPTDKQIREAQDSLADKTNAIATAQARVDALTPKSSQSARLSATQGLAKAQREAQEAQADLSTLMAGGTPGTSSVVAGSYSAAQPSGGGGAESWRPVVRAALAQYGPQYGITNSQAWEDAMVRQIQTESGGNPGADNPHDSNGRGGTQHVSGLAQFLPSTFASNNITGGAYTDPKAQIAAMIPYVANRYGMTASGAPNGIGQGHGYAKGGLLPGFSPGVDNMLVPLSGGEGIITPHVARQLGPEGIAMINSGRLTSGYAGGGGPIPTGVVLPPPNLSAAKAATAQIKATPKIQAPTASTRQAAPGPSAAPAAPAPGTPPPPVSAKPADKPLDGSPTPVVGAAPTDYNHNLAAINTGIASGASAIGSAVSMALGIAGSSGFAPGAGAIGQIAAGAIQEGGKIVTDLVNVGSSFLVGSVPGNLGGDGPAQGSTLTAPQNVPQTAQDNSRNYNIQAGYQPSDLINALQLHDAQQSQAANAQYRG